MRTPSEVYAASPRPYRGLSDLTYPWHDWTATVTHCGRICRHNRKINLSQVFAGQLVGVRRKPTASGWSVSCTTTSRGTSTMRPVGSSRSRTPSARACYPCLRNEVLPMSPEWTGEGWRRERDSNPRYGFPYSGFQDRLFQPLTHPSVYFYRRGPPAPRCRRLQLQTSNCRTFKAETAFSTSHCSIGLSPMFPGSSVPWSESSKFEVRNSKFDTHFILSIPMYGRSASGITTEPSFCW